MFLKWKEKYLSSKTLEFVRRSGAAFLCCHYKSISLQLPFCSFLLVAKSRCLHRKPLFEISEKFICLTCNNNENRLCPVDPCVSFCWLRPTSWKLSALGSFRTLLKFSIRCFLQVCIFFAGCPFDEQATGSSSVGQSKDKFNRGSENLRSGREKDEEGSIRVDADTAVDNSFVTAFAPKKAER